MTTEASPSRSAVSSVIADEESLAIGSLDDYEGRLTAPRSRKPGPELPIDKPIRREGLIRKEGGSHKSWKTRMFHLDEEKISYYKPGQLKSPLGTVYLKDYVCACVTGDRPSIPFCFCLQAVSTTQRVYYFSAGTREQMNEWITAINQSIQYSRIASGQEGPLYGSVSHETALICVRYLKNKTKLEGLFQSPGNVLQVKQCLETVKNGKLPDLAAIPNPSTVVSLLKGLFKDGPLKNLIIGLVSKELVELIQEKSLPRAVQSLLFGVSSGSLQLLKELLVLFCEVLKEGEKKIKCTLAYLAQSFGIHLFGELNVQQSELVLDYLTFNIAEIF